MSSQTLARSLDDIERRLVRIHPLATMGRVVLQFFATAVITGGALLLAGAVLLVALGVFGSPSAHVLSLQIANKTGFLVGMCVGGSYWIVLNLIGRMSKLAALAWVVLAGLVLVINVPNILAAFDVIVEAPAVRALSENGQLFLAGLLFIALGYYLWIVPIALLRGAAAVLLAPREHIDAIRDMSGGGRAQMLLGLPPLIGFVRDSRIRRVKVITLSALTSLFLAAASLGAVALPLSLFSGYARWAEAISTAPWLLLGLPVGLVAALGVFAAIGRAIERAEFDLMRFSIEQLQRVDRRPPVLFLRAFGDDRVELPRPKLTHLGRAIEFGRRRTNLDAMLLEEGTPFGPLVALGNPNDAYPPYGAARGYFDDKNWQQAVGDLVAASSAIVLCVDSTDGVWWEVEHLAARRQLSKTLFLIHPRHRPIAANRDLLNKLASTLGAASGLAEALRDTAAKGGDPVLAFFVNRGGGPEVLRSSTFSQFAYLMAVRVFIRGRLGAPEAPAT